MNKLNPGFKSSFDRMLESQASIMAEHQAENKLKFGISFLDEALRGINKTDLVLVGAPSGTGKTEIASSIAYKNAQDGKRVHGIFLEAYEGEIEMRQTFRLLSKIAKKDGKDPDFSEWMDGKQPWLNKYNQQIDLSFFKNISTKYREKGYSIDDLKKDLTALNDQTDLVVIDHLHYFDVEGRDENREVTEIVKAASDMINILKIPIVLVVHVRKIGKNTLIADQEDIQGTSNIFKIATKVVTFASLGPIDENRYLTLVRAAKNRRQSSVRFYVAKMYYDDSLNDYLSRYEIGKIEVDARGTEKFVEITTNKPRWFRGGSIESKGIEKDSV